MEFSTDSCPQESRNLVQAPEMIFGNWEQTQQIFPFDLEATARQTGALRRKREICNAGDYLRMVLMYALSDWSLRLIGAWALVQEIGFLSDVAVLKRLRNSAHWVGMLIGLLLKERCDALQSKSNVRLRLIDASVISKPGSKGTDWRVHLSLNLWPLVFDGMEVTNAHTGETLTHFAPQESEIRVADRGYAFPNSLGPVLLAGVSLVVRINWQNLPLETAPSQRLDVIAWLETLSSPDEQPVILVTPQGRFALRLLACPLPPQAAERARRRAHKLNRKKGHQVKPETLFAAGFLLLITNLPACDWPLKQVFGIYRLRWQIELAIKRLKSLLQLDHLRAKDPQLAQTYLLGKLLAALMVDEMTRQVSLQQPDWFTSLDRPISVWRLTVCLWESLRLMIYGRFDPIRIFHVLPALRRYFCDSPRDRPQQLAWARAFLDHHAYSSPLCV